MKASLRAVQRATERRDKATADWRAAIRAARADSTLREIAAAAGVTNPRIHQIVRGK